MSSVGTLAPVHDVALNCSLWRPLVRSRVGAGGAPENQDQGVHPAVGTVVSTSDLQSGAIAKSSPAPGEIECHAQKQSHARESCEPAALRNLHRTGIFIPGLDQCWIV